MDHGEGAPRTSTEAQFRIRRVPRRMLHRRTYEIEFTSGMGATSRITSSPVALIDPPLGPGDAWSVVRVADEAWDEVRGAWVIWPPTSL